MPKTSLSNLSNTPAQEGESKEWKESGGKATLTAKTRKEVTSLEELLEFFEVDTEVWEVKSWRCGSWGSQAKIDEEIEVTPLYVINAAFQRRDSYLALKKDKENFVTDMKEEFKKLNKRFVKRKPSGDPRHMLVPCIMDPHFGKLCMSNETGWENYDADVAESLVLSAASDLLNKSAHYKPELITFPVGNDLLHVDSQAKTTTNGTPQDMSGSVFEAYRRARVTMVKLIRMFREVCDNVHVPIVPGNHDSMSALMLGDCLSAIFEDADGITVDADPTMRKYVQYGNTLFMFDHGVMRPARLRELMQLEQRELWGETKFAEIISGHLHKKQEIVSGVDEEAGVVMRRMRSLTPPDKWHADSGYVGAVRAGEMLVYDKDNGYEAQFNSIVV